MAEAEFLARGETRQTFLESPVMTEWRRANRPVMIPVVRLPPCLISRRRRSRETPTRRAALDEPEVVHLDGIVRTILGAARAADTPIFNDDLAGGATHPGQTRNSPPLYGGLAPHPPQSLPTGSHRGWLRRAGRI